MLWHGLISQVLPEWYVDALNQRNFKVFWKIQLWRWCITSRTTVCNFSRTWKFGECKTYQIFIVVHKIYVWMHFKWNVIELELYDFEKCSKNTPCSNEFCECHMVNPAWSRSTSHYTPLRNCERDSKALSAQEDEGLGRRVERHFHYPGAPKERPLLVTGGLESAEQLQVDCICSPLWRDNHVDY